MIASLLPPASAPPEVSGSPVGPARPKIILVGEAFGNTESILGVPFVGESGKELRNMCIEAGLTPDLQPDPRGHHKHVPFNEAELEAASLRLTNVFLAQPPENNLEHWCLAKADLPKDYPAIPSLGAAKGRYLRPEFFNHLHRLHEELTAAKPNLIIAAGGTATWFLLGETRITRLRGYVVESPYGKVLPIFHPAAILRAWHNRPATIGDLIKARAEADFPEIRRRGRQVWVEPSIDDIERFYDEHLLKAELIPLDIETAHGQITCISFGRDDTHAICIPFIDRRQNDYLYWRSPEEHVAALAWVRAILDLPQPKVTQNGLYDTQWMWKTWGFTVRNWTEDTMLAHWAIFPESPKSLEFMASTHTNEAPWKFWHRSQSEKREE